MVGGVAPTFFSCFWSSVGTGWKGGLSTTATMGRVLTVACDGLKMGLSHPRWGLIEISRSSVRGLCRFEKWQKDIGVKKTAGRSSGVAETEDQTCLLFL